MPTSNLPPLRGYRSYNYPNPWKLTSHQYEALKEVALGTSLEEAAELFGVKFSTFYSRVRKAKKNMGTDSLCHACYLLGIFEASSKNLTIFALQSQKSE